MSRPAAQLTDLIRSDTRGDRVVPPTGYTAWLTIVASAALAFVAVFALALSFAAHRLADRWENELSSVATVRISASAGQVEAQAEAALRVLSQTPGVADVRALSDAEQAALLAPWLGEDVPVDVLPIPQLIEFREVPPGYDAEGLRLRLAAEAPGAVLDNHARWRRPLVDAAERLRVLGVLAAVLVGGVVAVLITLAAATALAANRQVIEVLRLVGAEDGWIARAFVRRFTLRTVIGAGAGAVAGMAAVALFPRRPETEGFLTALGFDGAEWLAPVLLPVIAGAIAFAATRAAAFRALRDIR